MWRLMSESLRKGLRECARMMGVRMSKDLRRVERVKIFLTVFIHSIVV